MTKSSMVSSSCLGGDRRRWCWGSREERGREGYLSVCLSVYLHISHGIEEEKGRIDTLCTLVFECVCVCVGASILPVCTYPFHNFLSLSKLRCTICMSPVGPTQSSHGWAHSVSMCVCVHVSVSAL